MSGGIDWGAGQREYSASMCSYNCSATPLTTAFTAPSSCSQQWTPVSIVTVYDTSLSQQGPGMSLTRNSTRNECLPPQLRTTSGQFNCAGCSESSSLPWISPGRCPQGWPTASTGGSVAGGVTTAYCCPPEAPTFGPATISTQKSSACIGMISSILMTLSFDSTTTYNSTTYVSSSGATTAVPKTYPTSSVFPVSTTTFLYRADYTAFPLVVRYRPGDFPSGSSSTPSGTPATETQNPDTLASGLGTGAKAGIGIGIALGALILLILGVLVYRRRKMRTTTQATQDTWGSPDYKAELHHDTTPPKELPAHVHAGVNEHGPVELPVHR